MKVYKGDILTVNKSDDVFQYLVEDKGRIVYVGNDLNGKYASCETVEPSKRALIPTFCDTHQHFAFFSIFNEGNFNSLCQLTGFSGLICSR